jgi:hypothetical protein
MGPFMLKGYFPVKLSLGELPCRLLYRFLVLGQPEVHVPNLPIPKKSEYWSIGVLEQWKKEETQSPITPLLTYTGQVVLNEFTLEAGLPFFEESVHPLLAVGAAHAQPKSIRFNLASSAKIRVKTSINTLLYGPQGNTALGSNELSDLHGFFPEFIRRENFVYKTYILGLLGAIILTIHRLFAGFSTSLESVPAEA